MIAQAVTDTRPGSRQRRAVRGMWALGDYHAFATATVWQLGPLLVHACRIRAGQRVLDIAAGTGNVAIRAAEAGAQVVASDITPEHFDAGRREASARNVELEWIEADAEALPFPDDDFDVVTSAFGAIFAPDHHAVAREMLRVCRPGGTIGMLNFRPVGLAGEFFELLGRYAPAPPPHALPPLLWGVEEHVRELLGGGATSLVMTRGEYVERSPSAEDYAALFTQLFGPVIAVRGLLAGEPDRLAAFDRELHDYVRRGNSGEAGGPAEYRYGYLLITATRQDRALVEDVGQLRGSEP
jgi:SAM-dependent methyltransferase